MTKYLFSLVILTLIFTAAGCTEKNGGKEGKEKASKSYVPQVSIISASQIDSVIKSRFGRPLFVDVWASWSETAVKEFPEIMKLYNTYKDNGVDFLILNVDLTSRIDSTVVPLMLKFMPDFPVHVIDEKSGLKAMKLLNKNWSGGIPASFIYDAGGKQEIFILGLQTYENLSKGIDSVKAL